MLKRGSYKGNLDDTNIIKATKFGMHFRMDSYSYAITQETTVAHHNQRTLFVVISMYN